MTILVTDEEFVLVTVPLTLITVVEVDGGGRAAGAATILDAVHTDSNVIKVTQHSSFALHACVHACWRLATLLDRHSGLEWCLSVSRCGSVIMALTSNYGVSAVLQ